MLYAFDIDGTLVRSFMREKGELAEGSNVCPRCGEVGSLEMIDQVDPKAGWRCEMCPWRGSDADAVYERVELLPNRRDRLLGLALLPGARFALVTNQGGVAFGYQTVEQVYRKIGVVLAGLSFFLSRPVSVHVCFTHPKATVEGLRAESEFRKPGAGMLLEAMEHHRVDAATTWFVGDMDVDAQAARAAGVKYYDQGEFFR